MDKEKELPKQATLLFYSKIGPTGSQQMNMTGPLVQMNMTGPTGMTGETK
jgi:hypothetical protein